jgi:hypothetical protein
LQAYQPLMKASGVILPAERQSALFPNAKARGKKGQKDRRGRMVENQGNRNGSARLPPRQQQLGK